MAGSKRVKRQALSMAFGLAVALQGAADASAQQAEKLLCRWGPPAKMAPVPNCGVPRIVEVDMPPNTWKLYFVRSENPGLSGYFHRSRTPGSLPRLFMRKVNLITVELYLCPSDFKAEKVLAFQRYDNRRKMTGRPTCRLASPGTMPTSDPGKDIQKPRPGTEPREEPDSRPGTEPQPGKEPKPVASKTGSPSDNKSSSGPAPKQDSIYDNVAAAQPGAAAPTGTWRKIDRLARLLGILSLLISVCCVLALAVVFRYFSRKVRRLEEES